MDALSGDLLSIRPNAADIQGIVGITRGARGNQPKGEPLGIVYGIVAATMWGLGDFFITQLTRRVGTKWALIGIQALSLAAWAVILVATSAAVRLTSELWLLLAATGVCHVLGLIFVYRAFEIGVLSLVSPISAGFAVVTAILALAGGERPPFLGLAGAGLLVGGIVLATRPASGSGTGHAGLRGVPEAILSAVAFGTMFWLFYFFVQPKLGYALPLVVLKGMAVAGTVFVFGRRHDPGSTSVRPGFGNALLLAAAAAGADTLAWLAYIVGTVSVYATVVTALASLFSVVTVLLAWIFLRERLAPHQWVGVAIILAGILLVSV